MFTKPSLKILPLLLLIGMLTLSSCAPLVQPDTAQGAAPTTVYPGETGEVDNPISFADPVYFQPALLQALQSHDLANLEVWMTDPVLTGTWREGQSMVRPDEALETLYTSQLGKDIHLEAVLSADLPALMGGVDPLSIPGPDEGVMYAYLVSGWGTDGGDEAILFITMDAADNLKWHGWLQVKGGFSGASGGGIQPYQNDTLGFSVFVPADTILPDSNVEYGMFLAPGEGHPSENRAAAFFSVELASGRTAQQVAAQLANETIAMMGAGYTGAQITVLQIEGEPAYALGGLSGQDINRRLFVVHNDQLYTFMFVPDNSYAAAYSQMLDLYAMLVNTLHFTR
jgi:hypothetical protein